jgi:hypothetical protein
MQVVTQDYRIFFHIFYLGKHILSILCLNYVQLAMPWDQLNHLSHRIFLKLFIIPTFTLL